MAEEDLDFDFENNLEQSGAPGIAVRLEHRRLPPPEMFAAPFAGPND